MCQSQDAQEQGGQKPIKFYPGILGDLGVLSLTDGGVVRTKRTNPDGSTSVGPKVADMFARTGGHNPCSRACRSGKCGHKCDDSDEGEGANSSDLPPTLDQTGPF
jgi:hypothetical protein